jgi:hypothetical protein
MSTYVQAEAIQRCYRGAIILVEDSTDIDETDDKRPRTHRGSRLVLDISGPKIAMVRRDNSLA